MTGEEFLQSKDIWHHPRVSTRRRDVSYDIAELLDEFLEAHTEQNSHKQVVMQTLPFSFVEWYSGMQKEKIESAYQRWMKEGNVAVGSEGYGEANTCAGGSKCVDIEIEEGYYQCEKCGRTSRG